MTAPAWTPCPPASTAPRAPSCATHFPTRAPPRRWCCGPPTRASSIRTPSESSASRPPRSAPYPPDRTDRSPSPRTAPPPSPSCRSSRPPPPRTPTRSTSCATQLGDDVPDGVTSQVTGPAAIQADLAAVFDGADTSLLLATAGVVALLLLFTYRSPVLWLVPLTVVGVADRLAAIARHAVARRSSTWPGTSRPSASCRVLVFGAGTDYALLLISRYRDELKTHDSRHEAMAHRRTPHGRGRPVQRDHRRARPAHPAALRRPDHPRPRPRVRDRRRGRRHLRARWCCPRRWCSSAAGSSGRGSRTSATRRSSTPTRSGTGSATRVARRPAAFVDRHAGAARGAGDRGLPHRHRPRPGRPVPRRARGDLRGRAAGRVVPGGQCRTRAGPHPGRRRGGAGRRRGDRRVSTRRASPSRATASPRSTPCSAPARARPRPARRSSRCARRSSRFDDTHVGGTEADRHRRGGAARPATGC